MVLNARCLAKPDAVLALYAELSNNNIDTARHLAVHVRGGGRARGGAVRQFTYTIAMHADRENNKN